MSDARRGEVERRTSETEITCRLGLDGPGRADVETGVGFLDHMLEALAVHGGLDLTLRAEGDLHVDPHHTVEDTGIVCGKALREALGERRGIVRFGHFLAPLDEALARAVVDVSGRAWLSYRADLPAERVGELPTGLVRDFFQALVQHAGLTLHVDLLEVRSAHHGIEAMFKAFARALREAVRREEGSSEIPSTKGSLDG